MRPRIPTPKKIDKSRGGGYTLPMRYDLAISDFDGTLLRRDDTVSARTVAAIQNFTAAGGVFGISTGRSFASIRKRLGELGIRGDMPVMCCQGALFRKSESGEILAQIPMDTAAAVAFTKRSEQLGLSTQFYTADEIYAPALNEKNAAYFQINRLEPTAVGCVSAFLGQCDMPVLKVLSVIDPADREKMLAAFSGIPGIKVFASHPMLIEAVSVRAGKENGLKAACARFGVPLARCAAFGDELNDVDMIRAAGLGVAVQNAVAAAKAAADFVTTDCDDDGVARVLEKIAADEKIM